MENLENSMNWLKREIERDQLELEREKEKLIQKMKNFKKDDIIEIQKPMTIWNRLARVLGL